MDQTVETPLNRRINWTNVSTVLSAAVLIGAEVFGAAFAGGWAVAGLFNLGIYGVYLLQAVFFVIGVFVMAAFVRNAQRVDPFLHRGTAAPPFARDLLPTTATRRCGKASCVDALTRLSSRTARGAPAQASRAGNQVSRHHEMCSAGVLGSRLSRQAALGRDDIRDADSQAY